MRTIDQEAHVRMQTRALAATAVLLATSAIIAAQDKRPASPPGTAETQIGANWIEISYGRPLKRGRTNLFGSGPDYGQKLLAGAPVWRAGANVSTRLKTPVPLQIGGKQVPAGEYSLFIDLKENNWSLIVSSWGAKTSGRDPNKDALWGAYNYTPDRDVARAPMTLAKLPFSIDQLTWAFTDVTDAGGTLTIMWDTVAASVPFTVAK
jgi:hypothetical protein